VPITEVVDRVAGSTGHYYSSSTITTWIKDGRLKAKKFGKFWMVEKASLDKLIAELTGEPAVC
jgi:hypothetical protein